MSCITGSQIRDEMAFFQKAISEAKDDDYDADLVYNNRVRINTALQMLDTALNNLKRADSDELRKAVKSLEGAYELIIKYNKTSAHISEGLSEDSLGLLKIALQKIERAITLAKAGSGKVPEQLISNVIDLLTSFL